MSMQLILYLIYCSIIIVFDLYFFSAVLVNNMKLKKVTAKHIFFFKYLWFHSSSESV